MAEDKGDGETEESGGQAPAQTGKQGAAPVTRVPRDSESASGSESLIGAPKRPGEGLLQRILRRVNAGVLLGVIGAVIGVVGIWIAYGLSSHTDELVEATRIEILDEIRITLSKELAEVPLEVNQAREEDFATFLKQASRDEAEILARGLGDDPEARAAALVDLSKLVKAQEATLDQMKARVATTHKAIGSAAFVADTDLSIRSFEAALLLGADDPKALTRLGYLYFRIGEIEKAHATFTSILRDYGEQDAATKYKSLGTLGQIELSRGKLDDAESYSKTSLALAEDVDDMKVVAANLGTLSFIESTRGNMDNARTYAQRSHALYEELGRKRDLIGSLSRLGAIEIESGNLDAAEGFWSRGLVIAEEFGDMEEIATLLNNLGVATMNRSNLDAAETYLSRSLELNKELGHKAGTASNLGNLGRIEKSRGNLAAAEDYQRRSLALEIDLDNKQGMAESYNSLGIIEMSRGGLAAAETHFRRSMTLNQELGSKQGQARNLANLGRIEANRGKQREACASWRQARELLARPGNSPIHDTLTSWIENEC